MSSAKTAPPRALAAPCEWFRGRPRPGIRCRRDALSASLRRAAWRRLCRASQPSGVRGKIGRVRRWRRCPARRLSWPRLYGAKLGQPCAARLNRHARSATLHGRESRFVRRLITVIGESIGRPIATGSCSTSRISRRSQSKTGRDNNQASRMAITCLRWRRSRTPSSGSNSPMATICSRSMRSAGRACADPT